MVDLNEEMRRKFHELGREKEKLLADMAPLQQEYDQLRAQENAIGEKIKPVAKQLKEAKAPLFDIDMERGRLARALDGKTGRPD